MNLRPNKKKVIYSLVISFIIGVLAAVFVYSVTSIASGDISNTRYAINLAVLYFIISLVIVFILIYVVKSAMEESIKIPKKTITKTKKRKFLPAIIAFFIIIGIFFIVNLILLGLINYYECNVAIAEVMCPPSTPPGAACMMLHPNFQQCQLINKSVKFVNFLAPYFQIVIALIVSILVYIKTNK